MPGEDLVPAFGLEETLRHSTPYGNGNHVTAIRRAERIRARGFP